MKLFPMVLALCLIVAWGVGSPAHAQPAERPPMTSPEDNALDLRYNLHYCVDEELGIRLLCNPEWEYQEENNAIMIIFSSDPEVTLTVVRVATPIQSVEHLNVLDLESMGQYKEGFRIERLERGTQRAVRVKAFSREDPDIRLLDYYMIRHETLYGFLFAVRPKDRWDDYKFLIQRVANSFQFLP